MRKIHIPKVDASFCCASVSKLLAQGKRFGLSVTISNFHYLPGTVV